MTATSLFFLLREVGCGLTCSRVTTLQWQVSYSAPRGAGRVPCGGNMILMEETTLISLNYGVCVAYKVPNALIMSKQLKLRAHR